MKKGKSTFIGFVFLIVSASAVYAQYDIPSKMKWWYEARFGMFIHFGSYSCLGHGEWAYSTENWNKSDYQVKVSAHFNPVDFDARAIAKLAKRAGMKYLVITAKHHEGFSMWPTQVESFKDVTGTKLYSLPAYTSFGTRDVLMELKDACIAEGIKFCLYYSILDWCHPSQEINRQTYYSTMASEGARENYIINMKKQLKELVIRYNPSVIWFDGDWTKNDSLRTPDSWWTKADGIDLYNYMISLDPDLIINERVARSFGIGDFECPEQEVPEKRLNRPWETCQTMNKSWGYAEWDHNYKTCRYMIRELVKVVSRDGNYLLNIGPKGDGKVPESSVYLLDSIGQWMFVNGESIYGTSGSPYYTEPAWGFYTKKEGKLFVHIFEWPDKGVLKVPSLQNSIYKIYKMNDPGSSLKFVDKDGYITVYLPENSSDSVGSVIVIEVAGMPAAKKI